MYCIKEIIIDQLENTIKVIDGIKTYKVGEKYVANDDFWGNTDIMTGMFSDTKLFSKYKESIIIPYTNEYNVKDIGDGYKNIELNVSVPQTNIDGYIIIIKYATNIKTDGEVLFRRYPTEIVVVLKDKNYIEVFNKRIEVINNKIYIGI